VLASASGSGGFWFQFRQRDLAANSNFRVFADGFGKVDRLDLIPIDFLPKSPEPEQLRGVVSDILIRHIPDLPVPEVRDCDYYLRWAKRSINLRDFTSAKSDLITALDLDPESIQAIHLVGVMIEMREEQSISVGEFCSAGLPLEGALELAGAEAPD